MSGDAASLTAFRQLLERTAAEPDAAHVASLTDSLVGPERGALLRRCAVPHDFDRALLRRLGNLEEDKADQVYAEFAELSLMQVSDMTLSMHERWRHAMWRWWLEPARREEFIALSAVLVDWFTAPAATTGEDPIARRRTYHLIGCREDEGFQVFEAQFRTARWRRRFSECTLLLRLAHEYDPILTPRHLAGLAYEEGKLASDMRQWERALPLLQTVADAPVVEVELRINAQVRIGHALRMTGRAAEALTLLEGARATVAAEPAAAASGRRVLYELGDVYRDLGRVDEASTILTAALAASKEGEDDSDVAGLLNSLGTVQLKQNDADAAIVSFKASLDRLKRSGEAMRTGAVLNNLGLAQLEHLDWQSAEDTFTQSLLIKRAAGDLRGEATTLLNLVKAQAGQEHLEDACASARKAAERYEAAGDQQGLDAARLTLARFLRLTDRREESAALLQTIREDAVKKGDEQTQRSATTALARGKKTRAWRVIAVVVAVWAGLTLLQLLLELG